MSDDSILARGIPSRIASGFIFRLIVTIILYDLVTFELDYMLLSTI